jgi:hypothetical protein
MLNELVGQYLQSADGSDLLKNLQAQGLSAQQATHAVSATAEGAIEHGTGGAGLAGMDLAGLAGSLLGGAGGGGGGLGALVGMLGGGGAPAAGSSAPTGAGEGLGGLLGGLLSGGGANQGPLGAMVAPISQIVAQKTGLAPAMASMVVSAVLPKILALFSGAGATPGQPAPAAGGQDLLSSLLR